MFISWKGGQSDFCYFFLNFDRDFWTLGIEIAKIWLQIRTRRHRIRLYANFCKFGCIISLENNQLACFFVTLYVVLVLILNTFIKYFEWNFKMVKSWKSWNFNENLFTKKYLPRILFAIEIKFKSPIVFDDVWS